MPGSGKGIEPTDHAGRQRVPVKEELDRGERLACQFVVTEDTEVETLSGFSTEIRSSLQESSSCEEFDPLVRSVDVLG